PFEPPLLRGPQKRRAVVERLRELDRAVAAVEELPQPGAPLRQRQVDDRLPLDLQQVEDGVDERRPPLRPLHRRKARPAVLVERADLAVDDAVRGLERLDELPGDVGETLRVVLVRACVQPGLTPGEGRDDAVADTYNYIT